MFLNYNLLTTANFRIGISTFDLVSLKCCFRNQNHNIKIVGDLRFEILVLARFDSTQPEVKSDTLCSLRQGGTCTQQLRKDEGGVVAVTLWHGT